ncbi:MAG: hypothetical protein FWE14_11880 [Lachnospiraceae bacterium]|nr:hypothetical protein [Lachnospiraceae bacterium]
MINWKTFIFLIVSLGLILITSINVLSNNGNVSSRCKDCSANATKIAGKSINISLHPSFFDLSLAYLDNYDIDGYEIEYFQESLTGFHKNSDMDTHNQLNSFPSFVDDIFINNETTLTGLVYDLKKSMIWLCDICANRIAKALLN